MALQIWIHTKGILIAHPRSKIDRAPTLLIQADADQIQQKAQADAGQIC